MRRRHGRGGGLLFYYLLFKHPEVLAGIIFVMLVGCVVYMAVKTTSDYIKARKRKGSR